MRNHEITEFQNLLDKDGNVAEPDMDSLVIATPWTKKHSFYYNQKINCMRAASENILFYDGIGHKLDDGRKIELKDVLCSAEHIHNRF